MTRRGQPEFLLSCAVADALRYGLDTNKVKWTHFPAGEKRTAMAGARLKRIGTLPGVADYLFWPAQGRTAFLELKAGRNDLNDSQEAFRDWMLANGYRYEVARSLDEVIQIASSWGILERVRAA